MKNLLKISIAVTSIVLAVSSAVIAGGGPFQALSENTTVMISSDGSEPLEFDENGDVTNLDYPNVVYERPINIALNPGEAEEALQPPHSPRQGGARALARHPRCDSYLLRMGPGALVDPAVVRTMGRDRRC